MNKTKLAQKRFINSFKGVDKKRVKKLYNNTFTKKDRLLFSNCLVKCKFALRLYYKRLNELKSQPNTAENLSEKKEIQNQIDITRNFLTSFVLPGIAKYFSDEEKVQLEGREQTSERGDT